MALLRVLPFDPEGRPVAFDTWHDDLQLYLLSDSKDKVSLFDLVSGAATAPPATTDVSTRSQWLSRDATARLAIRNHLPATECAHFGEHRTARALYDAVVARYSSPATAALGRLLLPYVFPELSAFATIADLVTHLRTSDARYRAAVPVEFLPTNQPPMFITLYFIVTRLPNSLRSVRDHFLTLDPTSLTVDLLEQHLLAAETSAVAVVRSAALARARVAGVVEETAVVVEVAVGVAVGAVVEEAEAVEVVAAVEAAEGVAAVEAVGPVVVGLDLSVEALVVVGASSSSVGARFRRLSSSVSAAAALGASESGTPPSTAPAEALHTFTLDSGASRCFFRDSTTLTPLSAPVPVRLADPSGGPVVASSSTVLPCPAVPSGSLSGLHLPSFSTNLVSTAALEDVMVTTTTPGGQRVSICTCTRTGRHLATFTRRPGSSLYRLATKPPQVAASAQVSASGQVAAACSCRLLSHQTLLWHHRLGHPSLPRIRGMHSRLLVFGLPRSLPPVPPSPAPPCLPCVEGRQRAAPLSSSFPPTTAEWQAAMDAEMASWKSTGTYVDEVLPPGVNIVDGMWIFRVKRPPGSPPAFKARYVARGLSQRQGVDYFQTFSPTPKMTTLRVLLHVAAQRDYELHSLDFSTAFLQGGLHEEIWLRRPPGFTGSFPTSSQWSLRRPVYGLRQAPREWHDTLRTTLAALGFVPSTADPLLFLRTDTSLPPFCVLVYVDDLVFATADTEALTLVKSELQKRHTCTDLGELRSYFGLQITRDRARRPITLTQSHMVHEVLQRFGFQYSSPQLTPLSTSHSLSAPPSDESVEPSGPCPEVVGCLMYLMTCTRPDLAYPLSLLTRYVAPGRHRKVHWDAAKKVLRYLCSTSGMGLVLGGRRPLVIIGHADASWVDDSATQRSS
ncbi:unnamed protein product [Closterium sp. NIES-54]